MAKGSKELGVRPPGSSDLLPLDGRIDLSEAKVTELALAQQDNRAQWKFLHSVFVQRGWSFGYRKSDDDELGKIKFFLEATAKLSICPRLTQQTIDAIFSEAPIGRLGEIRLNVDPVVVLCHLAEVNPYGFSLDLYLQVLDILPEVPLVDILNMPFTGVGRVQEETQLKKMATFQIDGVDYPALVWRNLARCFKPTDRGRGRARLSATAPETSMVVSRLKLIEKNLASIHTDRQQPTQLRLKVVLLGSLFDLMTLKDLDEFDFVNDCRNVVRRMLVDEVNRVKSTCSKPKEVVSLTQYQTQLVLNALAVQTAYQNADDFVGGFRDELTSYLRSLVTQYPHIFFKNIRAADGEWLPDLSWYDHPNQVFQDLPEPVLERERVIQRAGVNDKRLARQRAFALEHALDSSSGSARFYAFDFSEAFGSFKDHFFGLLDDRGDTANVVAGASRRPSDRSRAKNAEQLRKAISRLPTETATQILMYSLEIDGQQEYESLTLEQLFAVFGMMVSGPPPHLQEFNKIQLLAQLIKQRCAQDGNRQLSMPSQLDFVRGQASSALDPELHMPESPIDQLLPRLSNLSTLVISVSLLMLVSLEAPQRRRIEEEYYARIEEKLHEIQQALDQVAQKVSTGNCDHNDRYRSNLAKFEKGYFFVASLQHQLVRLFPKAGAFAPSISSSVLGCFTEGSPHSLLEHPSYVQASRHYEALDYEEASLEENAAIFDDHLERMKKCRNANQQMTLFDHMNNLFRKSWGDLSVILDHHRLNWLNQLRRSMSWGMSEPLTPEEIDQLQHVVDAEVIKEIKPDMPIPPFAERDQASAAHLAQRGQGGLLELLSTIQQEHRLDPAIFQEIQRIITMFAAGQVAVGQSLLETLQETHLQALEPAQATALRHQISGYFLNEAVRLMASRNREVSAQLLVGRLLLAASSFENSSAVIAATASFLEGFEDIVQRVVITAQAFSLVGVVDLESLQTKLDEALSNIEAVRSFLSVAQPTESVVSSWQQPPQEWVHRLAEQRIRLMSYQVAVETLQEKQRDAQVAIGYALAHPLLSGPNPKGWDFTQAHQVSAQIRLVQAVSSADRMFYKQIADRLTDEIDALERQAEQLVQQHTRLKQALDKEEFDEALTSLDNLERALGAVEGDERWAGLDELVAYTYLLPTRRKVNSVEAHREWIAKMQENLATLQSLLREIDANLEELYSRRSSYSDDLDLLRQVMPLSDALNGCTHCESLIAKHCRLFNEQHYFQAPLSRKARLIRTQIEEKKTTPEISERIRQQIDLISAELSRKTQKVDKLERALAILEGRLAEHRIIRAAKNLLAVRQARFAEQQARSVYEDIRKIDPQGADLVTIKGRMVAVGLVEEER